MIPKYKMLKDILLEELLDSKIARASLPRISACTCLKMNVMVKYRNKMKKSCSAYAFHKRIIQKLVDNRYAQKCCSAYAFTQKARLNQIPNQHANISKSCNEARLSPLPVTATRYEYQAMPSLSIWAQVAASCSQASDAPSPEQAMASTSGYSGFSAEFPTATAHVRTISHLALGMSLYLAKHTFTLMRCTSVVMVGLRVFWKIFTSQAAE